MNLPDYIRTVGEQVAAHQFGVSIWTIRSWRQGTRSPRRIKAAAIIRITQGVVDWHGIYRMPDQEGMRSAPAMQAVG